MSVDPQNLSPAARRTLPGRTAFQSKFKNEEERRAFYREIGRKAGAQRVVLSGNEAEALRRAYALLTGIVDRIGAEPTGKDGAA